MDSPVNAIRVVRQGGLHRHLPRGRLPRACPLVEAELEVRYGGIVPSCSRKYTLPEGKIIISIYQKPGALSLRRRLFHYLQPYRPMSNLHFT